MRVVSLKYLYILYFQTMSLLRQLTSSFFSKFLSTSNSNQMKTSIHLNLSLIIRMNIYDVVKLDIKLFYTDDHASKTIFGHQFHDFYVLGHKCCIFFGYISKFYITLLYQQLLYLTLLLKWL